MPAILRDIRRKFFASAAVYKKKKKEVCCQSQNKDCSKGFCFSCYRHVDGTLDLANDYAWGPEVMESDSCK